MPSVEERLRYWRDRATTAEVENATLSAENAALTERLERAAEIATARAAEYTASYAETEHKVMTLAGEAALISIAAAIRKAKEQLK